METNGFAFNKIFLSGRVVTQSPYTTDNAPGKTTMYILPNDNRLQCNYVETSIIRVEVTGKTAEYVKKYVKNGDTIFIIGALCFRDWAEPGDEPVPGVRYSYLTSDNVRIVERGNGPLDVTVDDEDPFYFMETIMDDVSAKNQKARFNDAENNRAKPQFPLFEGKEVDDLPF